MCVADQHQECVTHPLVKFCSGRCQAVAFPTGMPAFRWLNALEVEWDICFLLEWGIVTCYFRFSFENYHSKGLTHVYKNKKAVVLSLYLFEALSQVWQPLAWPLLCSRDRSPLLTFGFFQAFFYANKAIMFLALPLTSCVTLSKLLNSSVLQFSHSQSRDVNNSCIWGLFWKSNELIHARSLEQALACTVNA